MKCMVLEEFGAPLVPRERGRPTPGEGEAVLKVGACGVCQTDLKVSEGKHPAVKKLPIIPGHEIAGKVVEVGKGVDTGVTGKHAVVFNYLVCGSCEFCRAGRDSLCTNLKGNIGMSRDGGYAEYVKVPADCIFPISETIPFEKAATLTDAVATPYHALTSKAKIQKGETVAVVGVGGLGLNAVQIARVLGARVIAVDVKEAALDRARKLGAEWTINVAQDDFVKETATLTEGRGVDALIELTGIPEMEQRCLEILKIAGRFVLVAYNPRNPFQLNSFVVVSKELEVYGSRWCGREDFKQSIDLVSESKVDPVVGEILPLSDANLGLELLKKGGTLGRAVLIP